MFEQQRFRGNGTGAARAEEFRKGDEQMNRQEEHISHESNVIRPGNFRKTARRGRLALELTNSPETGRQ